MGLFRGRERSRRARFEQEALPHLDALYAGAFRLCRSEAEAADLVQETLLKAYAAFDRYEPGTHCKAWLYRILYNLFISSRRRLARERRAMAEEKAEVRGAVAAGAEPAGDHMTSEAVQRALSDLPDEFRLVVVLADLQDLSYREIAEVIDRPIGTVMSRLHRGRRLLQQRLVGQAIEHGIVSAARGDDQAANLNEYRRRRRARGEDG